MTVKLSGATSYNWSGSISPDREYGTTYFYCADPWYKAGNAYIKNLSFTNL